MGCLQERRPTCDDVRTTHVEPDQSPRITSPSMAESNVRMIRGKSSDSAGSGSSNGRVRSAIGLIVQDQSSDRSLALVFFKQLPSGTRALFRCLSEARPPSSGPCPFLSGIGKEITLDKLHCAVLRLAAQSQISSKLTGLRFAISSKW